MKILITGTAGFIGYHTAKKFLEAGNEVVGVDNINDYYDVTLKHDRLSETGIGINGLSYGKKIKSTRYEQYTFIQLDLTDKENILKLFQEEKFDKVVHLAAQAGVRHSIKNPSIYIESNVTGFINILEGCRNNSIQHLVYASTSSVYGLNSTMPLSLRQSTEHPISLYSATKKANELMAHSYSHLFGLPTTGLRFFTVYGPWGRPDMAFFLFTKAINENKPIDVYNNGLMIRDFTYIDDIVESVYRVSQHPPKSDQQWNSNTIDPATSSAPYRIYNVGNSNPITLMDYIKAIESALNKTAKKNFLPMQPGDMPATQADIDDIVSLIDYRPSTSVQTGINEFVQWFVQYYRTK